MSKKSTSRMKSLIVSGLMTMFSITAPLSAGVTLNASAVSNNNYAKLLQYSLYFYDTNMCGNQVSSTSAINWRSNCHTSDDADGGFHDAGDHAMFGLPQGYSASTLGWSYYEFKDAYDALGQTSHFKTVSDYFATFFKNATELDSSGNVSRICYQKGDGTEDHNYWGSPEDQSNDRQQFWSSNGASDVAAEYAAALALSYINFGNEEDLKYAKALYEFSIKYNQLTVVNEYASTSYEDDQAWAAGWLYLATNDDYYKTQCASKLPQYIGWTHSWNNVELGAACVYAHITGNWNTVNSYLAEQCTDANSYYFLSEWGSARYNASTQLCALVATKNSTADFSSWCQGQMDYLLGNNPANTCFVTGYASNSAKNAHHRAASGYSSYEEMDESTTYSSNGHTLIGALVGGPTDANGTYTDSLQDYTANEVAIDYNAGLVGAAAGLFSVYQTGSLDTYIDGVGTVSVSPIVTTTATTSSNNSTSTTTTTGSTSSGLYTITPNETIVYSQQDENDRMIGWEWADFNIPYNETVTKVEVKISASKSIGKWQGAFGSSTKVSPDYWTQSSDMEESISGTSGTITWTVDSSTASTFQYNYSGMLKFGTWWIDCDTFTIDEVNVYTDAYTGATTTTTTANNTTNQTTTTTTSKATSSSNGTYEYKPNQTVVYSQLPDDDKMIGWEWSNFNIPTGEKVTKVEINVSSSNTIGKWQGAFGTSTTVSPDYWTQSSDMEQTISGTSGTITWTVDSSTADIIQYNYGGMLKFGIWWVDGGTFTINSIKVYTDGSSTATTTATTTTTKATTTTTKTTTTTTKTTTATTTTNNNSSATVTLAGDANYDGKVDIADAVAIAAYVGDSTKNALSAQGIANGDVQSTGNGINAGDALMIQQYLAKVISSL